MITIKELSESVGVSKVGITKWIERNGYKDDLQKIGNKYLVPADVERAVRENFAHRETKGSQPTDSSKKMESEITAEILALLRDQLESKDKEIERLHQQVDDLQKINADMVKAVRELNTLQALQLTDGSPSEPLEDQLKRERSVREETENDGESRKSPGFIARIFKRF